MSETHKQQEPDLDSRTQLPGRDAFYREVGPLLDKAASDGSALVLLDIDIDGIDFALRTFGPFDRDRLVSEVGLRLTAATQEKIIPYHILQGRFALVLSGVTHRKATIEAKAVIAAFHEAFDVAGAPYRLEPYIGISHFPNHVNSMSEWVRTSVFACHQARLNQSGYAIYDQAWDERERERFRLMVDLEQALENHTQIQLAYQPKLDLSTGQCVGVEALCRWHHPRLGLIPPGKFLPFVERTPLMLPLTETTLAQGLADLADWRNRGFEGKLAINLSPILFREPDLLERLSEHFRFSNLSPEAVHFEITETGIMEEPNRGTHTLNEIRSWGSSISVDDFGTGHSSLAYLADLPIDAVKIDKHFIQNLDQPWGEAIVGAACTLAHKLGLRTIAEGIEEESQLRKSHELGCKCGQGFYFAWPMAKEAFQEWLEI